VIPAVTGKLELVYAGEQEGPVNIARSMVGKAVRKEFGRHFQDPYNKKEKLPEENPYYPVISWFEKGNTLTLGDRLSDAEYRKAVEAIPDMRKVMAKCAMAPSLGPDAAALPIDKAEEALMMELLLEGLHLHSRLSKENLTEGFVYGDMMTDIFKR
jgi:magnesium chelatase subunit I